MILLMGLAGSGKGTQAQFLSERRGYKAISTGEMLRQHATEDQHRRIMTGELLHDDEITDMVSKTLDATADLDKCLLDGYPRSVNQAKWLLSQVKEGRFELSAVIYIHIAEEVVRQRLIKRARADDTDASIAKRFEEYRTTTLPMLDYLREQGVNVCQVDGDQTPEAVHEDVVRIIKA